MDKVKAMEFTPLAGLNYMEVTGNVLVFVLVSGKLQVEEDWSQH
jgi:hypothetical protein